MITGSNAIPNKGLRFNGKDSYVVIPHRDYLKNLSNFTIDIRVKIEDISNTLPNYDWQSLFAKDTYSSSIGLMISAGKKLRFYHSGLTPAHTEYTWSDLDVDEWYRIRVSYNGSKATISINGRLVASNLVTGVLNQNENPIYIGRSKLVYPLNGSIEEFKIYSSSLTPNEENDSDLISHYSFDETRGASVYDMTMRNNATVYNAVWNTKNSKRGLHLDGKFGCVRTVDSAVDKTYIDIEMDVTYRGVSNKGSYGMIWQGGDSTGTYIAVQPSNSNRIFVSINTSTGQRTQSFNYSLPIGIRKTIRVLAKDNLVIIFVDGVEVARDSVSYTGTFNFPSTFQIGAFSAGDNGYVFDGVIHRLKYNELDYDFESLSNLSAFTVFGRAKLIQKKSKQVPRKNLYKGFITSPFSGSAIKNITSESRMEYTPDILHRNGFVYIDVKPSTNYSVSFNTKSNTPNNGTLAVFNDDATVGITSYNPTSFSFNSGGRTRVRLYLKNSLAIERIVFENIQFEEGSKSTVFDTFRMGEKRVKSKLFKSPNKVYPFTFKRFGMVTTNEEVVRINQPRIDNGILVEEATKNIGVVGGVSGMNGITYAYIGEEEGYKKYSISGTWNSGGYPYSFNLGANSFKALISCSASCYLYTNVPQKFAIGFGQLNVVNDGNMTGVNRVVRVGNYSAREDFIHSVDFPSNAIYVISNPVANGTIFDPSTDFLFVKNVQVEQKPFATSFIKGSREQEAMYVPSANRYIDSERGSLELEFSPLRIKGSVPSGQYGFHDLVLYKGAEGFMIRRSSTEIEFYSGASVLSNLNIPLINYVIGDTIKYRVDWNKTLNTVKLTVNNDPAKSVTLSMFNVPSSVDMYVGSRDSSAFGVGSAIYKSLVIRNRDGETVYKL